MSAVAERVTAGMAFLDEHDPDWWRADVERAIDLDTLNVHAMDSCILGQRCPLSVLAAYIGAEGASEEDLYSFDWAQAYWAYGFHLRGDRDYFALREWAADLGFNAIDREYLELTAEWRRVIEARRAAS